MGNKPKKVGCSLGGVYGPGFMVLLIIFIIRTTKGKLNEGNH